MSPPSVSTKNGSTANPTDPQKSWKKINEERKALKKKRKQDKLLKGLEDDATEKNVTSDRLPANRKNPSTISIAVPGSILENAQSAELRTYVAGQIARAACIFRVNEIIVFDDIGLATARETKRSYEEEDEDGNSRTVRSSSLQLARILQYLECPQYLRKFFFPLHKDLKHAGLLNPLDTPHHLRQQNIFPYREGIVCDKKAKEGHSYVNVGLLNDVLVNKAIAEGVRVTVKLDKSSETSRKLRGEVVSPDEPRRETGVYWGYTVRIAHTLSEIFTKSPYAGGYDATVGTSDKGKNVHSVPQKSIPFNHMLVVFGGLMGLEAALNNDDNLNVDDPALLFDEYVNVLPKQGSRTIRTEEALLIALAALQEKLSPNVEDTDSESFEALLPRSEDTGVMSHLGDPFSKKQKKFNNKQSCIESVSELSNTKDEDQEVQEKPLRNGSLGSVSETEFSQPKTLKNVNNKFRTQPVGHVNTLTLEEDTTMEFEVVPPQMGIGMNAATTTTTTSNLQDLSRFD